MGKSNGGQEHPGRWSGSIGSFGWRSVITRVTNPKAAHRSLSHGGENRAWSLPLRADQAVKDPWKTVYTGINLGVPTVRGDAKESISCLPAKII